MSSNDDLEWRREHIHIEHADLAEELTRLRTELQQVRSDLARVRVLLQEAEMHPNYGIPMRRAWERQGAGAREKDTLIFFDIDELHNLNRRLGYREVDWRIREVLQPMREVLIGQWNSGDEFVILCPWQDALGIIRRLRTALRDQGITATWAVVARRRYTTLTKAVQDASQWVLNRKEHADGRNSLSILSDQGALTEGPVALEADATWAALEREVRSTLGQ